MLICLYIWVYAFTYECCKHFFITWWCLILLVLLGLLLAINFLTIAAEPAFSTECSVVMCLRPGAQILWWDFSCSSQPASPSILGPACTVPPLCQPAANNEPVEEDSFSYDR